MAYGTHGRLRKEEARRYGVLALRLSHGLSDRIALIHRINRIFQTC